MISLDDTLLRECGLTDLDPTATAEVLTILRSELEVRVGAVLVSGLSTAQLDEFSRIEDAHEPTVRHWVAAHAADHERDPLFHRIRHGHPSASSVAVLAEYAATKWLEQHRPDYRDRVADVFGALRKELAADPVDTIRRLVRAHR